MNVYNSMHEEVEVNGDTDDLKTRLDNLQTILRKTETRLVQYQGLTTLTNRSYKRHKGQVTDLEQRISDRNGELCDLESEKVDLCRKIYSNEKSIGKLENRVEATQAIHSRCECFRTLPVKERIAALSKHSNDLHSSLNSRLASFPSPTIEKRVEINGNVLVLNKNGTFYWEEEDSPEFKRIFREKFIHFLSSNETSLAISLLESLGVSAEKILDVQKHLDSPNLC